MLPGRVMPPSAWEALLPISLSAIRNVLLLRLEAAPLVCDPEHHFRIAASRGSPTTLSSISDSSSAPLTACCRCVDLPLFLHATAGVTEVSIDP